MTTSPTARLLPHAWPREFARLLPVFGRLCAMMLAVALLTIAPLSGCSGATTARAAGETAPHCDYCGETIEGSYMSYSFQGKETVACESCRTSLPQCALCARPAGKGSRDISGKTVCRECAPKATTCGLCTTLITGSYKKYQLPRGGELPVCASCEGTAARCSACTIPLVDGEQVKSGANTFCRNCAADLKDCSSCELKILGTRYIVSFREGDFCESCWKNRPHCSMCGAPVENKFSRLSDGRALCRQCSATSVTDPARIVEIYNKVKPFLEKKFGAPLKAKVTVRMVGPEELEKASASTPRLPPGSESATPAAPRKTVARIGQDDDKVHDTGHSHKNKELGKFIRRNESYEILILSGMPENWVWETVAHEMAHAWQSEKNPKLSNPAWCEGFAQWAAELMLMERNEDALLERLRLRKDFYGQAFRYVSDYEDKYGFKGVVDVAAGRRPAE